MQDCLAGAPPGFGQWQVAPDYRLSHPFEIAIVSSPEDEATQRLLSPAMWGFWPHRVIAYGLPNQEARAVPLLEDRALVDGQPAAYLCRDFTCQAPVTDAEALQAELKEG